MTACPDPNCAVCRAAAAAAMPPDPRPQRHLDTDAFKRGNPRGIPRRPDGRLR